jgi:hypothetical protein
VVIPLHHAGKAKHKIQFISEKRTSEKTKHWDIQRSAKLLGEIYQLLPLIHALLAVTVPPSYNQALKSPRVPIACKLKNTSFFVQIH